MYSKRYYLLRFEAMKNIVRKCIIFKITCYKDYRKCLWWQEEVMSIENKLKISQNSI